MFSPHPRSLQQIFFASIKGYKDIFISMSPISVIWAITQFADDFNTAEQLWLFYCGSIFANILSVICFCWGICFVFDFLAKHRSNYTISLITALRRLPRVVVLFAISLILISLTAAFWGAASYSFDNADNVALISNIFFATILALLLFCILNFGMVYLLEIFTKDTKLVLATKRAIKISFRLESMGRGFCYLVIMALISIVIPMPILILIQSPFILYVVGIFLTILWFPLQLITLVYFYNDLILRFEKGR